MIQAWKDTCVGLTVWNPMSSLSVIIAPLLPTTELSGHTHTSQETLIVCAHHGTSVIQVISADCAARMMPEVHAVQRICLCGGVPWYMYVDLYVWWCTHVYHVKKLS